MKMQTPGAQHGSFGIPPQMQDAFEKTRTQRKAKEAKEETSEPPSPEEPPKADFMSDTKIEDNKQLVDELDPIKILEKLGAKFTTEDFQKLLFKGYYEVELDVVPNNFKATFRTLNGEEYDAVDELLGQEVRDTPMTNDGFSTRRSMWVIALGITHLMGKPVAKVEPNKETKQIDTKELAKARRAVLGKLAPALTNLLIQKHGAITVATNLITTEPGKHLKNS